MAPVESNSAGEKADTEREREGDRAQEAKLPGSDGGGAVEYCVPTGNQIGRSSTVQQALTNWQIATSMRRWRLLLLPLPMPSLPPSLLLLLLQFVSCSSDQILTDRHRQWRERESGGGKTAANTHSLSLPLFFSLSHSGDTLDACEVLRLRWPVRSAWRPAPTAVIRISRSST